MRTLVSYFVSVALVGCAHTGAHEPEVLMAHIAQPCAGLHAGQSAPGQAVARVVVEIASVLTEDLPDPVGPYLRGHAVRLGGATTVLIENDATEVAPWATCPSTDCTVPNVWAFAITPHLFDSTRIQLSVLLKPPSGLSEESQVTVIETRDQAAVVLPFRAVDNGRPTTLVITPYRIDDDPALQRLLSCKQASAPTTR
jgi:hypothetical protein